MQKATPETVRLGISLLKKGQPVAFPTDTVYALGVPVDNFAAARKIYDIKNRPLGMALPVLLGRPEDVELLAPDISPDAWKLIREFWPGALTLVLKKTAFVPDIVTAGCPTVAVRMPAHPLAIEIIEGAGVPLVGTSANIHGSPSPVTAQEVASQLGDRVSLIIDAGRSPGGVESTILDLSADRPRILRQGALPRHSLEKYCRIY